MRVPFCWWSQGDSNSRPLQCECSALPTVLWPLIWLNLLPFCTSRDVLANVLWGCGTQQSFYQLCQCPEMQAPVKKPAIKTTLWTSSRRNSVGRKSEWSVLPTVLIPPHNQQNDYSTDQPVSQGVFCSIEKFLFQPSRRMRINGEGMDILAAR